MSPTVLRAAGWIAGAWCGVLLAIAFVGAPAAFATVTPEMAGRIAGRMFAQEAAGSLMVAVLLFIVLRARARAGAGGGGSLISAEMLLVAGALFCTVAGYYGLQPMMAAARAGQGSVGFGTLHGVSMAFYGVKTLLVGALAWRLLPRQG